MDSLAELFLRRRGHFVPRWKTHGSQKALTVATYACCFHGRLGRSRWQSLLHRGGRLRPARGVPEVPSSSQRDIPLPPLEGGIGQHAPRSTFSMLHTFQVSLSVHSCHTAASSCRDGLAVDMVLNIAGRKNSWHTGFSPVVSEDVAIVIHFE